MQRNWLFFKTENGRGSPDTGKRHFNKTVARKFGTPPPGRWHASACYFTNTSSLFSAIQIYILHLLSRRHIAPMEATCGQTNNTGLRFWGVHGFVNGQQVWMDYCMLTSSMRKLSQVKQVMGVSRETLAWLAINLLSFIKLPNNKTLDVACSTC